MVWAIVAQAPNTHLLTDCASRVGRRKSGDYREMFDIGSSRSFKGRSSLVRRLVQAKDDPAKQRIREWLGLIDDERLLDFGLTPDDIAALRVAKSLPR